MSLALRHSLFVAMLGLGVAFTASSVGAAAMPGQRLFMEGGVVGRISGHEMALPQHASRCSNCHAVTPANADKAKTSLGPSLSAASLTTLKSRRGGPPSRFDEASLCQLLRTGVDPAGIVTPQVMPRYVLTDTQCRDLWRYLLSNP